jgi:cytochrome b pre-mRNA-processing protein 3
VFSRFKTASTLDATASKLYGAVVAGARDPAFYRDCGVPDTPAGRYEMLVLHVFLMAERVRQISGQEALERTVVESFITDFDDNMREMGVSDIRVHSKVKKAAAGLFERALAYRAALLAHETTALAAVLVANIPELAAEPVAIERLAKVVRDRALALTMTSDGAITAAEFAFNPASHS